MESELALLCRICLRNTSNVGTENIYDSPGSNQLSLLKMLRLICAEVFSSEDNLLAPSSFPRIVCMTCKNEVVKAYELYEKCVESDRNLRKTCIVKLEKGNSDYADIQESADSFDVPVAIYFKSESDLTENEAVSNTARNSEDATSEEPLTGDFFSMSEQNKQTRETAKKYFPEDQGIHSSDEQKTAVLNKRITDHLNQNNEELPVSKNQCLFCLKEFCNNKSLKRHVRKFHSEKLSQVSSDDNQTAHVNPSSAVINRREDATLLENISMSDQNNQISDSQTHCVLCLKRFCNGSSLQRHLKKQHPGKRHLWAKTDGIPAALDRSFACPLCDKKFQNSARLRDHTRRHSNRQPFLCTFCGKAFKDNSNLRQHLMRHSGQKSFSCDQCPSKFYTKAEKATHMVTHTKEKRWACETCGTRFTMKNSLVKHERIHTGNRPFPCDVCDLRFAAADHLKRHMRIHTGERPYKCHFCERSYSQINDLVKHSRTHLGSDNLYQCDRCESSFRLLTDLRDHYKVHFQVVVGNRPEGEGDSIEAYTSAEGAAAEIRFTSLDMLKRIYEKTRQRTETNKIQDRRETVTSIPVDISEIPIEK
ncbi:zinc finger protein 660-like [Malaya genurostris]|uniref:zinc finger protein 660-like n=1 Tax=Malaya genurostris TaxID=325434 RepID=UPI0026F3A8E8|nr:zinc finger protein 660-like [Malaya genurostris]